MVLSYTGLGNREFFGGFTATGTAPMAFTLTYQCCNGPEIFQYKYRTNNSDRTAVILDKMKCMNKDDIVRVYAYQETGILQLCDVTILGGV